MDTRAYGEEMDKKPENNFLTTWVVGLGLNFLCMPGLPWRISYELWYLHLSLTLRMGARAYGEEMDKNTENAFLTTWVVGLG